MSKNGKKFNSHNYVRLGTVAIKILTVSLLGECTDLLTINQDLTFKYFDWYEKLEVLQFFIPMK